MIVFFLASCGGDSSNSTRKSEAPSAPKIVVEKETRGKEPPLPPEVKIRLKRDGKENYSWELSGSDADEILKVNEKLRRQLGGETHR